MAKNESGKYNWQHHHQNARRNAESASRSETSSARGSGGGDSPREASAITALKRIERQHSRLIMLRLNRRRINRMASTSSENKWRGRIAGAGIVPSALKRGVGMRLVASKLSPRNGEAASAAPAPQNEPSARRVNSPRASRGDGPIGSENASGDAQACCAGRACICKRGDEKSRLIRHRQRRHHLEHGRRCSGRRVTAGISAGARNESSPVAARAACFSCPRHMAGHEIELAARRLASTHSRRRARHADRLVLLLPRRAWRRNGEIVACAVAIGIERQSADRPAVDSGDVAPSPVYRAQEVSEQSYGLMAEIRRESRLSRH